MLTSFVPILHILLVQSASIVTIPVKAFFGEASKDMLNLFYLIISAFCLLMYYRTDTRISSVFYAIVCIACLMSLIMLVLESVEIEPYYLNLMIMSTGACLPLWLLGFAKERRANV
ncbi:MAG: hypothetical protein ACKOXF_07230 [Chitinophagaceae bacterium]